LLETIANNPFFYQGDGRGHWKQGIKCKELHDEHRYTGSFAITGWTDRFLYDNRLNTQVSLWYQVEPDRLERVYGWDIYIMLATRCRACIMAYEPLTLKSSISVYDHHSCILCALSQFAICTLHREWTGRLV
jgi:hypothetical protein